MGQLSPGLPIMMYTVVQYKSERSPRLGSSLIAYLIFDWLLEEYVTYNISNRTQELETKRQCEVHSPEMDDVVQEAVTCFPT